MSSPSSESQSAAIQAFVNKWENSPKNEQQDTQSFWIDLLQMVFGIQNATNAIQFEKKVLIDGGLKRIDGYLPATRVLIEQKSGTVCLDDTTCHQGQNITPLQQALNYNDHLSTDEKAKWIVTCNFNTFRIYNLNALDQRKICIPPEQTLLEIPLSELPKKYHQLNFLVDRNINAIAREVEIAQEAGKYVDMIYSAFLEKYEAPNDPVTLHHLNKLCVRLVFCYYAEDAGVFRKNQLLHYLEQFKDNPSKTRKALDELFLILNTKVEDRDKHLGEDDPQLAAFPYVNGGLFAGDRVDIPGVDQSLYDVVVKCSRDFDWSPISPTIFGAVFESTLNPQTRRAGGMHYTSIENIHKVIDPLFVNELRTELDGLKNQFMNAPTKSNEKKLQAFQMKLGQLTFLDPACGSGNFLTETYLTLRRMENEALKLSLKGQTLIGATKDQFIHVHIHQFYGIEINDFAVTVAKTALWIAESQMLRETEAILNKSFDFLPLQSYSNIVEGNALRMDWGRLELEKDRKEQLALFETNAKQEKISEYNNHYDYIVGNPPFVGYSLQSKAQKEDIRSICVDTNGKPYKTAGKIDYVACWYFKAAQLIQNTTTKCAFVSTNSITQGEQVAAVWKPLFDQFKIHFDFAYRTFRWDSESDQKARVHCVIVGFSSINQSINQLYMPAA